MRRGNVKSDFQLTSVLTFSIPVTFGALVNYGPPLEGESLIIIMSSFMNISALEPQRTKKPNQPQTAHILPPFHIHAAIWSWTVSQPALAWEVILARNSRPCPAPIAQWSPAISINAHVVHLTSRYSRDQRALHFLASSYSGYIPPLGTAVRCYHPGSH